MSQKRKKIYITLSFRALITSFHIYLADDLALNYQPFVFIYQNEWKKRVNRPFSFKAPY